MRLVYFGTPAFAVPPLEAIFRAGHDIRAVYSQPPRPAGRGYAMRKSDVQIWAEAHSLPVHTPERLDEGARAQFAALAPEIAVVAAYGQIFPRTWLATPPLGCINIHASLLPRWRGANPIAHAILAGDRQSGVTIMRMEAGLDTGPILLQMPVEIGERNAGELHDALAAAGATLIVSALERLEAGTLMAVAQPDEGALHAPKLPRERRRLDWRRSARELARQIRAFAPRPGAWFVLPGGEEVRLIAAEIAPGSGESGEILDASLRIACGEGALRALTLQRAGRKPLAAAEFLRGVALGPGQRLP